MIATRKASQAVELPDAGRALSSAVFFPGAAFLAARSSLARSSIGWSSTGGFSIGGVPSPEASAAAWSLSLSLMVQFRNRYFVVR